VDRSRVERERAYAVRLAARVERQREERVRGLRLAIRLPLVVRAPLEVRVVEVDAPNACPRDETDTTRAPPAFRSAGQRRAVSWKWPM
jgi:hypothetical protein